MSKKRMRERLKEEPVYDDEEEEADDDDEKKEASFKSTALGIARDFLVALGIITIVIVGLTLYAQSWPPLVVVESASMQHGDGSSLGAIDTGDMVISKDVDNDNIHRDVTTWADKEEEHYGTYGDVIIFERDGTDNTPVIHRAICWVEANLDNYDHINHTGASYDIPALEIHGATGEVVIGWFPDFTDKKATPYVLSVNFTYILKAFENNKEEPFDGFLTKGDGILMIDQGSQFNYPVKPEWVIAKAKGEIPWYGLLKLQLQGKLGDDNSAPKNSWLSFFLSLACIIAVVVMIDFGIGKLRKRMKEKKESAQEKEEKRPKK